MEITTKDIQKTIVGSLIIITITAISIAIKFGWPHINGSQELEDKEIKQSLIFLTMLIIGTITPFALCWGSIADRKLQERKKAKESKDSEVS